VSFDTDERSVQGSRPRDAYEFVLPAVTYRLTSGVRDLVVNGQTYRAGTIGRGEAKPAVMETSSGEIEIGLIVTHALAQRALCGLPPRIEVNVYRKQLTSGESELVWTGRVVAVRSEGDYVTLLVAQRLSIALTRRLPIVTVGRQCAHVLYDSRCTVDRDAFRVDTTVSMANGRSVTVASIGGNGDDWAKYGELVHVASGERVGITIQLGTNLELDLRVPMQAGDAVQIYAGCAHDIDTCRAKFANHVNFGGLPDLPATNLYAANSYSVFRPVY
jgi:uncharacterized phage protein (TIGR02218 family)